MMMLRKIKVYGSLAKFLKRRVFEADVANPAEAIRFLTANFPEVRGHMSDKYYKVLVSNNALAIGDEPEQLHYPVGAQEEIKVVPVMAGAGKEGFGSLLLGAALITTALLLPAGAAIGTFGLGAGSFAAAPVLGTLGAGLVLKGTAQLLTPTPRFDSGSGSDQDPRKSYSFSGIQNISRQGVPVPIIYGETIVGSVTVSSTVLTFDPPSED